MPAQLWGETAGLLRGTADTVLKSRELSDKSNQAAANNATELAKTGMTVAGGLVEQQMKNEGQQLEITQALADGAKKVTGDAAWDQMVGQKMDARAYSALLIHGQKQHIANSYELHDVLDGDKKQTFLLNKDTGDRIPVGVPGTGKPPPAPKTPKDPAEKDAADLLKLEKDIASKQKSLTLEIKRGGLPDVAFGGKPGNMRSLAQTLSGGELGNLKPEEQVRANVIKGMMTSMAEQNNRANEIRARLKKEPVDYTGFGNSPPAGGDQLPDAAKASLKEHQGSPVTFGNGQTWMMDKDGNITRVGG